ncbi:WD40-repeat-containing domain protein [Spinellus fusiger]|nr:WD40-repeat-containing domain protein [Spinellus fusiger]
MSAPPAPSYIFRGHAAAITTLVYFNKDEYLVSGDANGVIIIWRMKTRRPILQWKAHKESCLCVRLYQDRLVSQGRDDTVHVWKLSLETQETQPQCLFSIAYDSLNFCQLSLHTVCNTVSDQVLIAFPSQGDTCLIDIYDLSCQSWLIRSVGKDQPNLHRKGLCMAVQILDAPSNLEQLSLLVGYEDGSVAKLLCDVTQKVTSIAWETKLHKEPVLSMAINTDATWAISTSADNELVKYCLLTGTAISHSLKKSGISAVAIRSDDKLIATAGHDGRTRLFSSQLRPLAVLACHRQSVYAAAFASVLNKDHWLVSGGKDGRISLWSIY